MSGTFSNVGMKSNIYRAEKDPVPQNIWGEPIEISYPVGNLRAIDNSNMPLAQVDEYTANQKTIVQNIFNKENQNEQLNYKNTFYLSERGDLANKEANTIFGYGKIYEAETVSAGIKANYTSKVQHEKHLKNLQKVQQGFEQTSDNVYRKVNREKKESFQNQKKHEKFVRKTFRKMQSVVGVMVGTITQKEFQEQQFETPRDDINHDLEDFNIQRETKNGNAVQANRSNIRNMLGVRSDENQEKIRLEREEKAKLIAFEEAQKAKKEKEEEMKMAKFYDLKALSQKWKIYDEDKLKEAIRNEIVKGILKEEERKNFDKIAENLKKPVDSFKLDKEKEKQKRKINEETMPKKVKEPKKAGKNNYSFSIKNVRRLNQETQEDYAKRVAFIQVDALRQDGTELDDVKKHKIRKDYAESVLKNTLEKNGHLIYKDDFDGTF